MAMIKPFGNVFAALADRNEALGRLKDVKLASFINPLPNGAGIKRGADGWHDVTALAPSIELDERRMQELAQLLNRLAAASIKGVVDDYPMQTDDGELFKRKAERAGFNLLGAGYFSMVFSHKDHPEHAFKVGLKKEDAGAAWAAYCRAHVGPHLPKILYMDRMSNVWVAIMPKYEKNWGNEGLLKLAHNIMRRGEPVQAAEWAGIELASGSAFQHDRAFLDTAAAAGAFFKGMVRVDLHGENVMRDADFNLIMTDPFSYTMDGDKQQNDSAVVDALLAKIK